MDEADALVWTKVGRRGVQRMECDVNGRHHPER
jgi:hypothetical protein